MPTLGKRAHLMKDLTAIKAYITQQFSWFLIEIILFRISEHFVAQVEMNSKCNKHFKVLDMNGEKCNTYYNKECNQ